MKRDPKSAVASRASAPPRAYRLAIVGAGTLKGKELSEVLPESGLADADLRLLDDEESIGQLEGVGEEMTFVQRVARDNFEGVDVAFFASDAKFTERNWQLAREAGCAVVDLSYALEAQKEVSIRAPWLEQEQGQAPPPDLQPGPVVVAHPAAIMMALLITRLQKAVKIRTAVANVFEPASERGRRGLDELHGQTVNLLSFQSLPKEVYDAQVAFNMVSRYGARSQVPLASTERRISDHFSRICRNTVYVPSLMLLQAPIFHAYVISLYVQLQAPAALGDVVQALRGDHITVAAASDESPSAVAAAGQQEILADVRSDARREDGIWIWAAADNLRVTALNALAVAEHLLASRPKGQVQ